MTFGKCGKTGEEMDMPPHIYCPARSCEFFQETRHGDTSIEYKCTFTLG